MKLHLPLPLRKSIFALFLCAFVPTAGAAVLHPDVSIVTYTDFAQNTGRYQVGTTNALLQHLNADGVVLTYTGGQADYVLPQQMINFEASYGRAVAAAYTYNCVSTVKHVGAISSDFTSQYAGIGTSNALKYKAIEISGNATFSTVVDPAHPSTAATHQTDHKVTRLSKLITDISPMELYDPTNKNLSSLQYFHAGSGVMCASSHTGFGGWMADSGQFVTGAVYSAWQQGATLMGTSLSIASQMTYTASGISNSQPLPWISQGGDSGSPTYVWDASTGSYKYFGATYGGNENTGYSIVTSNTAFDTQVAASYNEHVDMSTRSTVYLNAVSHEGSTLSSGEYSTTIHYGEVTDAQGNVLTNASGNAIQYNGIASGLNTWSDLSSLKDTQNWYAYDQSYVQASVADLFPTENLVFSSNQTDNHIILNSSVDLGVGYTEFCSVGGNKTSYTISSAEGGSYLLNSAGILAGANTEVHLQLTNPADYVREWRKTGAGDLYIEGDGNNDALLNLGGSGTTYLNRQNGYAAYNVLANNGSTVVLQGGTGQIARDFTFGHGGGTLDMNGNSMEWQSSTDGEGRFTINALTEDALIANYSGTSTLRYTENGSTTWLGSFADSADSSLKIVYEGGGTWTMNSIRTRLQHADSGLQVSKGSVVLSGSNTVHALGSQLSASDKRYFHEDDWHYADATMNVAVDKGANFTLGSHARLIGSVTVADGGTYTMQEGVRHQEEYIEGFSRPEDTYTIRDYYGHKGDTILNGEGTLAVQFSEGTTANTIYEGNISGTGNMTVDTARGSLTLSGTNTFSGSKSITNGTLILDNEAAAGDLSQHLWKVNSDGAIAVLQANGNTALNLVDADSEGVLLLTQAQEATVDFSGHTGISAIGALAGKTVEYGSAEDTLNIHGLTGEGTLIVQSALSGSTPLNIDGRGYKGGAVVLNNISDYTGAISVGSTGGSMALSVAKGQELSGITVNILSGGTLQAIGEQQSLAGHLNFSDGSSLKGSNVTLTQGAQVSGTVTLDVDSLQTSSGATLNIATGGTMTVRDWVAEGDIELNGNLNYEQLTVQNGATLQLRAGGRLDAENAVTIAGSGVMRLNLQTLQDKVELKNGGTMFGNGGTIGTAASVLATEGTGTLSAGDGTLTVNGNIGAAEGATLVLAGNQININTQNPNDALNGYVNSEGGVLDIQSNRVNLTHNNHANNQTIAQVALHIGGTVRISQDTNFVATPKDATAHPFYNFNCLELSSGKTLTFIETTSSGWSNHWNINELKGEGNIVWQTNIWYHSATRNSHMLLNGANSFVGSLLIDNNNAEGTLQSLELAHNKAATYMKVQMDGYNATNLSGLAINTANAEVAGINGNEYSAIYTGAAKNSGNAATAAGLYNLTLTGSGVYTHAGSIAGDASNGLNITMNGSGSQTFSGSSVVVHDVAALKGSLLFTSNPTLHGNISIAQGAALQLGDSISLNEGETLSVLVGESGKSAALKSALVLNGGQLIFDASGINTDTTTLLLEKGISFAEGVTTHNIELINTSTLEMGKTYQLSSGDWSSQTVETSLPAYLEGAFNASDTGLSFTLSLNDGYSLWDGSAVDAQQNTTYVFIDPQGSHNLELSENLSIGNLLLPDSVDYNISGSSLTANNLNVGHASLHIQNTTTASSYSADEGEIIIEESGTLNLTTTRSGKVELQNLSGTGTLGIQFSGDYGNTLAVDADFKGDTYVKQGNFTINGSTYGNTLRLAGGVNFQLNGGSTVTLEKDLVLEGTSQIHQNSNATLTINGSVTGDGTYDRRGGGSLTINGTVDLGAFTQAASGVSTTLNAATNLGSLTVSSGGSLTIAGSTTTGNSIGNTSISGRNTTVTIGGDNSQHLKGDISVTSGGKLAFSGSGADILDYNAGKNIVVDGGTIDFGTTRQTIQGWNITLKNGATLSGSGASYTGSSYTAAMDFNHNATINVESGANTISANMRLRNGNARTLGFNVAEGASVNVSGRMHADSASALGTLQKKGAGDMTISSQVALGTIHPQAGNLTLSYTGAQNVVGDLDASQGNTCRGVLNLAKDVELKVTGNIWGCSGSALALAEGSTLISTRNGVILSTREGATESRLVCNATDGQYSVDNSDFELSNGHLKYDSSTNATLRNQLTNSSVENYKGKKLTVDNSANTLTGVHATVGEIAVLNLSSVDLQNLEAAAGLTVSFYTGSEETASAEANVTVHGSANFGAGAHLNANLTLATGATLQVAEGGLSMGSDVALTAGGQLGDELLGRVQTLNIGDSTTLFTSVDRLILNDGSHSYTYLPGELSAKDNMLASTYFTNLTSNDYVLTFNGSGEGNGTLAITMVPEPASATLSLLALAALAMRRRRKS